ncbi:unnamed protein product, partial [Timema podura]|nr:unnamed protein product [Timema podura]
FQVSIGQTTCTGSGPNKKLAKRAAAEGLLEQLGYLRPTTQPVKPTIKAVVTDPLGQDLEKNRKVTFLEDEKSQEIPPGGSSGRQLVPGLLLMADGVSNSYIPNTPSKAVESRACLWDKTSEEFKDRQMKNKLWLEVYSFLEPNFLLDRKEQIKVGVNLQTTATIAKELLKGGNSPTAEALAKSIHKNKNVITGNLGKSPQNSNQNSQVVRPKDQLLYLAQLLNFNVQFSDFPKSCPRPRKFPAYDNKFTHPRDDSRTNYACIRGLRATAQTRDDPTCTNRVQNQSVSMSLKTQVPGLVKTMLSQPRRRNKNDQRCACTPNEKMRKLGSL